MAEFINDLPYLNVDEMRKIDDIMLRKYKIRLEMMMENAGRGLAAFIIDNYLEGNPVNKRVLVLAGTGGNGGGAVVCARHLANKGTRVEVAIPKPQHLYKGVSAHQLTIIKNMGIPTHQRLSDDEDEYVQPENFELIVDGLIGYGLNGMPEDNHAEYIHWANTSGAKIVSLDIPSGLNGDTGEASEMCIRANATYSLALPKIGLIKNDGPSKSGDLYLGDIGVPPETYYNIDKKISTITLFGNKPYIKLKKEPVD